MEKLRNKKSVLIYSAIGMLFTFAGIILISLKKYDKTALILIIIGILIAFYGIMRTVTIKSNKKNEQ
ncbi:hypothetical protein [Algibacter sp. L1A34]|uniref:hypothetical protein n=1 Tax=Algibacter sp. L1A34 TaxID=2686365 RepID=UPI00131A775E|nr:hypothetical protein [Algibacter sp. L1A34]